MKLKVITIGKMKKGPHQAIVADYVQRLGHYLPFEMIVVKDEEALLKRLQPTDYLVICDERGEEFISTEFASFIEERQVRSTKSLIFALGPAEGWSEHARAKGKKVLSLSRFTMQHDLAAIVLLEQLYRACMIIRGEPYHK